jgi:dienelactone hydrolase
MHKCNNALLSYLQDKDIYDRISVHYSDLSFPRVRKMVGVILACRKSLFKKRSRLLSLGFLLVVTLLGCTAHIYTPLQPEVNTRVDRQPGPRILPYEKGPVPFENSIIQEDPKLTYQLRHLKIPSIGENGQENNLIQALYYRSNTAGKLPLVIVLPIWGEGFGMTYPPEKITSTLRSRSYGGMHILRVLGERESIDWKGLGEAETEEQFLSIMARMAQRQVTHIVDISRVVDWAEGRDEIDATRIGLIGFSHSAITGSMVAVNEPRFAAVVLVMGGAHPHRILAFCNSDAARLRDKILPRFGWTAAEYEQAIEPFYRPIDVANYPGRTDPSRILIFDSQKDQCVPQDARDDLWEALGRPARISFLYGHKTSFLSMTPLGFYWTRRVIYEFFESTL